MTHDERVFKTNSPDGCLLITWTPKHKGYIGSRLDKLRLYSVPCKEGERHPYYPEVVIKAGKEITGTDTAERLLNW